MCNDDTRLTAFSIPLENATAQAIEERRVGLNT